MSNATLKIGYHDVYLVAYADAPKIGDKIIKHDKEYFVEKLERATTDWVEVTLARYEDIVCPRCNGTGYVYQWNVDFGVRRDCPDCTQNG